MTDLLTLGKKALAAQPFSRLLGAKLVEFSAERVEITVPIREQTKQQNGFVHGGVKGRVSSVNGIFISSSNEIGAFKSGLTTRFMGAAALVVFGVTITLLVVSFTGYKIRKLRDLQL